MKKIFIQKLVFPRKKHAIIQENAGGIMRQERHSKASRILSCIMGAVLMLSFTGCQVQNKGQEEKPEQGGEADEVLCEDIESAAGRAAAFLGATDALGRKITPLASFNASRKVGIFYFLWTGEHESTGSRSDGHTLDISRLPEAELRSASDIGRHHYWGEPLYGYYRSDDEWVFRKHLELLTLAGVDYLVFDYTNSDYDAAAGKPVNYYKDVTDALFPTAVEMVEQGWNIPKFVFMLNKTSDKTVKCLYEDYYTVKEYEPLWFRAADGLGQELNREGKPWVICGDTTYLDPAIRDKFYIRQTQWPNEAASSDGIWDYQYKENGFPWMSWERVKNGTRKQYCHNGIMSVSIAQHVNGAFSDSVLLENGYDLNYGRGFSSADNGGYGSNNKERVAYGTNFQEQWDYAIAEAQKGNVNNVFVTGWNEWVAQKQPAGNGRPDSYFVDLYNDEFSRDAEMSAGPLGDNYYMQLVRNIRTFKGIPASSAATELIQKQIDIDGGLSQWEGIAGFADFRGDTAPRDHASSNDALPKYKERSGRNDIVHVRAVYDAENITFLITCAKDITDYESGDKTWMNILLAADEGSWNGYRYAVNRKVGEAVGSIEKLGEDGEGQELCGWADIRVNGKYLTVQIPRSAVGMEGDFTLQFKVCDHVTGYTDILNYYIEGDCAPIGRFNYTVSGKANVKR